MFMWPGRLKLAPFLAYFAAVTHQMFHQPSCIHVAAAVSSPCNRWRLHSPEGDRDLVIGVAKVKLFAAELLNHQSMQKADRRKNIARTPRS